MILTLTLGIDTLRVTEVGLGARLGWQSETPLERPDIDYVIGVARSLLHERLDALQAQCAGVGIIAYGLVERASGIVVLAPNLGWRNVDLPTRLGVPAGIPLYVDNVARLAAIAEARRGKAHDSATALYIHAAVGLGGALIIDGQPMRGRNGFAGEYGHLPFGQKNQDCHCGARGCWETEVDQLALARAAHRAATGAEATAVAAEVLAAARDGDAVAREAVDLVATGLGRGLGALVNLHDPDVVVLAAHAADIHQATPALVDRAMREAVMDPHREHLPPVRSASFAAEGPELGAADVLFDRVIARPSQLAAHTVSGST